MAVTPTYSDRNVLHLHLHKLTTLGTLDDEAIEEETLEDETHNRTGAFNARKKTRDAGRQIPLSSL